MLLASKLSACVDPAGDPEIPEGCWPFDRLPARQAWMGNSADDPNAWLRNTPALQFDHPAVQIQVKKTTQLKRGPAAKAVACFDFLRGLPFKTVADPTVMTAPAVLRGRCGDSYAKGLLFVAMMRALDIPARLRMVTLGPDLLHGLLGIEGRCISHAIGEAYLAHTWVSIDAYCVDLQFGLAARARLLREGRKIGYGVHMDGEINWDGANHALGHFSMNDPTSLPIDDLGTYDDPSQLVARGLVPRLGWTSQARRGICTALQNRRIDALRRSIHADGRVAMAMRHPDMR